MSDKPDMIIIGKGMMAAMWEAFADAGPRHRLVARWINELGWNIEPHVYANFVSQDPPNG
jgi:hypothetical protein